MNQCPYRGIGGSSRDQSKSSPIAGPCPTSGKELTSLRIKSGLNIESEIDLSLQSWIYTDSSVATPHASCKCAGIGKIQQYTHLLVNVTVCVSALTFNARTAVRRPTASLKNISIVGRGKLIDFSCRLCCVGFSLWLHAAMDRFYTSLCCRSGARSERALWVSRHSAV